MSNDTIHTGTDTVYYSDLNWVMEETAAVSTHCSTSLHFQTFLREARYWFSSIMCLLVPSKNYLLTSFENVFKMVMFLGQAVLVLEEKSWCTVHTD